MKLSDMFVEITFTEDGRPTVTVSATFDDTDQMQEYLGTLKATYDKGLAEKQSKEVIDSLNKARGKGSERQRTN